MRRSSAQELLGLLAIAGSGLAAPPPVSGKRVFAQCAGCHAATTTEGKLGPSLKGLFRRSSLLTGRKVTDTSVRAVIVHGATGMPGYQGQLSERELDALVAYLKTL